MASSSKPRTSQVFVCFRGSDLRYGFLTHLYAALDQTGMFIYKEIDDSRKGGKISAAIFKAIAESEFAIIIFSENFASSRWCLLELTEIMSRKNWTQLVVLPVFFKVKPSDVRRVEGIYGRDMRMHQERSTTDRESVRMWKCALHEAGSLMGWHLDGGCEAELITNIVREISAMTRFDVFLSFRGKDVRDFVNSLYGALVQKRRKPFMDSENLLMAQDFPPALKDAIEQSNMYVVVFSENYAESWWCLKELVQILRRTNKREQRMLPIFYKVELEEVREQKQCYGKALAEHEIQYGKRSVKKWREALSEAANVKGIHLHDGSKDDWIPRIVEEIGKMMAEIRITQ
ncbi:TMV resistance protein N-like [Syzygium oleosum]|uniref:TMV resistance protein N-like n=1 Tax=Syzygium oleosum TaxID=219896 RepID=UPI0024BBAEEA|nr:TMV resistance protein N-like [Syzygium oleosum]